MLARLPLPIRVPLALLLLLLNTVGHTTPLFVLALVKALLPFESASRFLSRVLVRIAESWIATNVGLTRLFTHTRLRIQGLDGLSRDGWYLVLSNHQSWVDIVVLQEALNRRIPFLKFFLKKELIWVPLLGLAWWALDFPFMKRYSKETLEKRPELRGKDIEVTRKACQRFARIPVSVMNFVEGTRFTPQKHSRQQSPFKHLLRPKAGGTAFVLQTMGDMLQAVVDVTIVYPGGRPTLMDFVAGRVRTVDVSIVQRPIPRELTGGDYESDPASRERFQNWINELWAQKDATIESLKHESESTGTA